jgi:CDP-glycerol glycerophosphotransferase
MHLGLRDKYHKIVDPIFIKLFHALPVSKNKIVFSNFNGRGYGDNPKYIAEEVIKRKLNYKMYWIVSNDKVYVPEGITKVKYRSLRYIYEMATTKVFINNIKNGNEWNKKKGQYYIQTWHGSLVMKYVESEVEESLGKDYVKQSKKDSEFIDTFLVASKDDKNIIGKWFWYHHELWETGSPRSDVFFNVSNDKIKGIKTKLGLDDSTKILLYSPTFRDDNSTAGYNINLEKVVTTLEKTTRDKWVALVRLHPNAAALGNLFEYNEEVINVCNYPDAQDLCLVADAMITDYSSIMLDMFLQKKPVFLYTNDYDDYIANSRPMHGIYNKLPCKRNNTEDDLLKDIESCDKDVYLKKLKHFMEVDFMSYDDGHASERVADRIKKVIETDYQSPYYSK